MYTDADFARAIFNLPVDIWKSMATKQQLHTPTTYFKFLGFLRFAGPVLHWTPHRLGEPTKIQSKMGAIA